MSVGEIAQELIKNHYSTVTTVYKSHTDCLRFKARRVVVIRGIVFSDNLHMLSVEVLSVRIEFLFKAPDFPPSHFIVFRPSTSSTRIQLAWYHTSP